MRVPAVITGVALLLAYAWWAVGRPPFSSSATAAVVVAGIGAAIAGALRRHKRPRPPGDGQPAWPWLVLLAAGGLWQLAAYLQHPREEHPTLSSLANGLLDSQPARALAFVLWLLGAVELARR